MYGKYGRIKSPFPKGERHYIQLDDCATMTYDVFQPFVSHPKGTVYKLEEITLEKRYWVETWSIVYRE